MTNQYGVIIALAVFVFGGLVLAIIGIRGIKKEDKETHEK